MGDATIYGTAMMATAAAGVLARGKRSKVTRKALHGIKFPYSLQKDSHAAGRRLVFCFVLVVLVCHVCVPHLIERLNTDKTLVYIYTILHILGLSYYCTCNSQ